MREYSILIGGKAGAGIDKAGAIIARIMARLGYRIYLLRDYPSIIRGGHTFSIIRAAEEKIAVHKEKIDFLLALNQDTLDFHKGRLKEGSIVIYDSDSVKLADLPEVVRTSAIALGKIIKEENAQEVMRNSCILGAFIKAAGIKWEVLGDVFNKEIGKELELNLKVASRGFNDTQEFLRIEAFSYDKLPVITGNEALGLGLINAGLKSYVAYPMTPSSGILHFMASAAEDFGLTVIHPESEISVILMALGFAYMGTKTAVGTSGGGFCLMTEGVSFAGMSELPLVVVVGQRPGPSTGLPTYTSQTELKFVISAGQGEFTRLVIAPGDPQEAYYWAGVGLNLAWKYQISTIILTDTALAESAFSFDIGSVKAVKEEEFLLWDGKGQYKRYLDTETGVSPLAFVPRKDAIIKVNSYEHDESGITTENPALTIKMQEKRLRKEKCLMQELQDYELVEVFGTPKADKALLCWGSNKGVCVEIAQSLGLRVIKPNVLWPFPVEQLRKALQGVNELVCVENNATGQLADLAGLHGFKIKEKILKYDGRPFSVDELKEKVGQVWHSRI